MARTKLPAAPKASRGKAVAKAAPVKSAPVEKAAATEDDTKTVVVATGKRPPAKASSSKAKTAATAPVDGVAKKPHRWRAGTVVNREIARLQRSVKPCIPMASIGRVIREIGQERMVNGKNELRYQKGAIQAIAEAADFYMTNVFMKTNFMTTVRGRVTIKPNDLYNALTFTNICHGLDEVVSKETVTLELNPEKDVTKLNAKKELTDAQSKERAKELAVIKAKMDKKKAENKAKRAAKKKALTAPAEGEVKEGEAKTDDATTTEPAAAGEEADEAETDGKEAVDEKALVVAVTKPAKKTTAAKAAAAVAAAVVAVVTAPAKVAGKRKRKENDAPAADEEDGDAKAEPAVAAMTNGTHEQKASKKAKAPEPTKPASKKAAGKAPRELLATKATRKVQLLATKVVSFVPEVQAEPEPEAASIAEEEQPQPDVALDSGDSQLAANLDVAAGGDPEPSQMPDTD